MSIQKLLKSPARLLLIGFVVTSGYAATGSPPAARIAPSPSHRQGQAVSTQSRVRQELRFEGVQRWGLNE